MVYFVIYFRDTWSFKTYKRLENAMNIDPEAFNPSRPKKHRRCAIQSGKKRQAPLLFITRILWPSVALRHVWIQAQGMQRHPHCHQAANMVIKTIKSQSTGPSTTIFTTHRVKIWECTYRLRKTSMGKSLFLLLATPRFRPLDLISLINQRTQRTNGLA